jgi:hypothetical protein
MYPRFGQKTAHHCKECKKQLCFQCSELIFKNNCKSDYLGSISYKCLHSVYFYYFVCFYTFCFHLLFKKKNGSIELSELSVLFCKFFHNVK